MTVPAQYDPLHASAAYELQTGRRMVFIHFGASLSRMVTVRHSSNHPVLVRVARRTKIAGTCRCRGRLPDDRRMGILGVLMKVAFRPRLITASTKGIAYVQNV